MLSGASGCGGANRRQWFDKPNQAQIAIDATHARRTRRSKRELKV